MFYDEYRTISNNQNYYLIVVLCNSKKHLHISYYIYLSNIKVKSNYLLLCIRKKSWIVDSSGWVLKHFLTKNKTKIVEIIKDKSINEQFR